MVITLQVPVPVAGATAASVSGEYRHTVWPVPASAVDGAALIFTCTVEVETQVPLFSCHWNTYVPGIIPVTEVLLFVFEVINGTFGPLRRVHRPVSAPVIALPDRLTVVTLHSSCAVPAFAVFGGVDDTWIVTSLADEEHPVVMVHLNT